MAKTLFEKALDKESLYSRFIARQETLHRDLTDEEVIAECEYILEMLPYSGREPESERKMRRETKAILKCARG